ncbi:DinB superfamily protein [Daejeonella rubra]|uniref:DinB superfamily protein n=1 Tax=Daejeonella rubra TaxID=990371 RepID=A0A1G9Q892_9SPHI|nr:DinB family protein [Daejeonella rubra]SDM06575.1 DinB superfamily protein [Daejeonella rubra]
MKRPQAEEFPLFYKGYVDTVSDDVLSELEHQIDSFTALLKNIPQEKASFAYAEGKWTIKELAGHVIDTERIMSYRALRIARNDTTPLPGFDENNYVSNAHFEDRSLESLADEFAALRKANMYLIRSFNEAETDRSGVSNEKPISVRALIFIMAGHVNHHSAILKQRYL